ncbi:MAG: FGGY-family carbohydrate kinase, partial [Pseudomonadota bacterium]
RQIMETQKEHGVRPSAIVISGGAGERASIKQLLADASGYPVLSTSSPEPVLLGAAMLGAVASGAQPTLTEAMVAMSSVESRCDPAARTGIAQIHEARFVAFEALQQVDRRFRGELAQLV